MSPITHLLASWIVAAKTTDNPRDCRLVTLAGLLPDADGLGFLVDVVRNTVRHTDDYHFYQDYHHWYLHGVFGAALAAAVLACFAHKHWPVLLLSFLVFHLHLLCDFVGSRGPSPGDFWPIYYLGPLSHRPMFLWHGQWRLDGWENQLISIAVLGLALWMTLGRNDSVVGVFNRRADRVFVTTLRRWRDSLFPGSSKPPEGS